MVFFFLTLDNSRHSGLALTAARDTPNNQSVFVPVIAWRIHAADWLRGSREGRGLSWLSNVLSQLSVWLALSFDIPNISWELSGLSWAMCVLLIQFNCNFERIRWPRCHWKENKQTWPPKSRRFSELCLSIRILSRALTIMVSVFCCTLIQLHALLWLGSLFFGANSTRYTFWAVYKQRVCWIIPVRWSGSALSQSPDLYMQLITNCKLTICWASELPTEVPDMVGWKESCRDVWVLCGYGILRSREIQILRGHFVIKTLQGGSKLLVDLLDFFVCFFQLETFLYYLCIITG